MSEEMRGIVQEADIAYEAIRAINHLTIFDSVIAAPTTYSVLGNLKGAAGHMLAQALEQLAAGWARSVTDLDVYEDDGRNPADSVAAATAHLHAAAALAVQLGEHLEQAQTDIAGQGYRGPKGTEVAVGGSERILPK